MIRFCDREVYCFKEKELDCNVLITFLNQNPDKMVCILDEEERYIGYITYNIFVQQAMQEIGQINMDVTFSMLAQVLMNSMNRDYVILGAKLWEEGREYFKSVPWGLGEPIVLPVVDEDRHLICFAWQDDEANRELRMLDELIECENALGFQDVYAEYDSVTVYGCNELAYYFIQYLKQAGIAVNAVDPLWEKCSAWKEINGSDVEALEYKNYSVYAEGIGQKPESLRQRCSVSVEFECIDQIYEANICKGIIADAKGDFEDLLEMLQNRPIGLLNMDEDSLNVYDGLRKMDLDIVCFVSDKPEEQGKFLFGKETLSMTEAMEREEQIVFIESESKYSAWGSGPVDFDFYYYGLKRNERLFLWKDYMELPDNGFSYLLEDVLKKSTMKLVLVGDFWFCLTLKRILERKNASLSDRIVYCDILGEYEEEYSQITQIHEEEIQKEDLCLILVPPYYHWNPKQIYYWQIDKKVKILAKIRERGICNVISYPSCNTMVLKELSFFQQSEQTDFKVGKIVIGAIAPYSGNIFIRGLLDNHPDILMLEYGPLNNNLFSICVRLASEQSENILSLLWKFYDLGFWTEQGDLWEEAQKIAFIGYMGEMLLQKERFTSQELFVMIHIAHAKMWNREVKDLSAMTIYWEPHCVSVNQCEDYAIWLNSVAESGCILNLVRSCYIRSGSMLKTYEKEHTPFTMGMLATALDLPEEEKKEYPNWERFILKFEDLKLKPKEMLQILCEKFSISWSDTLLNTTLHGEQDYYGDITGFDLAPVYRTYETYYSVFDRFRISLINGPLQKKYGYPYVSSLDFSRRELQQMFLKEFHFEEKINYPSEEEKLVSKKWAQNWIAKLLWMTRRIEIMERNALLEGRYEA